MDISHKSTSKTARNKEIKVVKADNKLRHTLSALEYLLGKTQ